MPFPPAVPADMCPGADARGAFLRGLRAAHATGLELAAAAGRWARGAEAETLADALGLIQEEAEEAVHRVEYILSSLRRGARGGASWIGPTQAGPPGGVPAEAGGDAALAGNAARLLGRMAQETRWLEQRAHDLSEFQAARLLRMSAEEQARGARRLEALAAGQASLPTP